ncbi:MAG: hypothetical protein QNJ70_17145 [Xenococcaceae cyanobacterium MO_207.B15]|nr:hypothetical protein [Xenococcaceae cyanobacterium MO_207.B15]MDJ0745657.1 hypothetical protein [Xenococcaceae cyanobacterium MO_167.B27]
MFQFYCGLTVVYAYQKTVLILSCGTLHKQNIQTYLNRLEYVSKCKEQFSDLLEQGDLIEKYSSSKPRSRWC